MAKMVCYPTHTIYYQWYWPTIVNCKIVIGRYHKYNYIYYVHMVSADQDEDSVTGWYYRCYNLYYVHMVLADHGEYNVTGW
jgi:hypothetical protein